MSSEDVFGVRWDVNFTRMPNWLLDVADKEGKPLSAQCIKVYFALASFADNKTLVAYPSQKKLSEAAGMGLRTVQRYLSELIDLKIISKSKNFNGKDKWVNNVYVLNSVKPANIKTLSNISEEQKYEEGVRDFVASIVEKGEAEPIDDLGVAKNGRKRTPNDEIWDGFHDFLGTSPKADKTNQGKWMAGIKRLKIIYEDLNVEVTQYKALTMTACAAYVTKFKDIALNPQALANNWENIQPKKYEHKTIKKIQRVSKYGPDDLPAGVSIGNDGRMVIDG